MTRRDSLGRKRRAKQEQGLLRQGTPGRESRSHNVNMSPEAHDAFRALLPAERGDLIKAALAMRDT